MVLRREGWRNRFLCQFIALPENTWHCASLALQVMLLCLFQSSTRWPHPGGVVPSCPQSRVCQAGQWGQRLGHPGLICPRAPRGGGERRSSKFSWSEHLQCYLQQSRWVDSDTKTRESEQILDTFPGCEEPFLLNSSIHLHKGGF